MSKNILNDDEIDLNRFEIAAKEIDSDNKKMALWYKAFSESMGDENASKANYIKLRVEELRREAVANASLKHSSNKIETYSGTKSSLVNKESLNESKNFNLYEFLNIRVTASNEEISDAITKKEFTLSTLDFDNKDKNYGQSILTHAKSVLFDPAKKAIYDQSLKRTSIRNEKSVKNDIEFASFLERYAASAIDSNLISYSIFIIIFIADLTGIGSPPFGTQAILIGIIYYYIRMESSSSMATIGKQLIGIKVTSDVFQQATVGQITGRFFGKFLSTFSLLLGYLIQPFNSKRQALHDMLANTLVIRSREKISNLTLILISFLASVSLLGMNVFFEKIV